MKVNCRVHRLRLSVLRYVVPVLLLLNCLSPAALHAESPDFSAVLSRSDIPARGRQEAILTIKKFGRYAVTVRSEQGTGLQLIDRMAGPGTISGVAGERDGRLDLFLERGEYKIVIHGHEKASGSARLEAHPFQDRNAPQLPALIEYKLNETELKDFEQASYWLEIRERKLVLLEAAGRSLADMRLWKDGAWLVDAAPVITTVQPITGRPLRVCRLAVALDPGLYLLSAYGGLALPWAEDSGLHPFYLRHGIPELGSVTRKRFTLSPFGTDRFIVPGLSTYFRVELAEARELSLQAGWFNKSDPFSNNGPDSNIRKNSSPPVAELLTEGNQSAKHLVVITGESGTPYVFQHFESNDRYSFQGTGEYWISSVHSGHPQDSVDSTAVLVSGADTYSTRPLFEQTIELDQATGYSRRANLLDPLTLFLKINAKGAYQVLSQGVEARVRIEPFFTSVPMYYAKPKTRPGGSTWDLDAGYYVLTIEPEKKGIMDLIIRPASWVSWVWGKLAPDKGKIAPPVRAAVRFPKVSLNRYSWYTMHMNRQPEVRTGLVIRSLPLNLADPLPMTQRPDETVTVPFLVSEEGTLRAEVEDGSYMDLSVDNGPWQKMYSMGTGRHSVSVRSTAKDTINYALFLEPRRLSAGTPLPALSQAVLDSLPNFPVLTDGKPLFFDLERNSNLTFNLQADKSALYQVQSTGLLATEGDLRSRTTPRLVRESENGKGRNFFIRQYLHEGDYQVTVAGKGRSKGHLGLIMDKSGLIQAGFLTSRTPARLSLEAGKAAAYQFIITNPGEYRVRAFGLARTPKCRLEDKDGWPVVTPNSDADLTRTFEKGRYRLILLPENTDARLVTLIEPVQPPRRFKGHGPHRLPLAVAVDHTWREPESQKERRPDQWNFELPADGEVSVELTGEMQGELLRINPGGTSKRAAFIPPARGWQGRLQAGSYRIDAASVRVNNQAAYRVAVRPVPLMAGLSRDVGAPSVVPVAIGRAGLVELSSFGGVDVKARLTTEDGLLIAENDDRPDDWNFHISAALKPGNYRLHVEPVGPGQGACTVSVRVPKEEGKKALLLPANASITLTDSVQLFPLTLPAQGELLMLSARAPENIGMAVEVAEQDGWKTIGSASGRDARLEVPLREPLAPPSNVRYRLRLWSMDRRATSVELSALFVSPPQFTEGDLKRGIDLSLAQGARTAIAAAAVRFERGGLLRIPEEFRSLRWSAGVLRACEQPENFLPVQPGFVWITGETATRGPVPVARAERLGLGSGVNKAVQLRMRGREKMLCDLASDGQGPVLVIASARAGRPAVELIEQGGNEPVNTGQFMVGEHGSLSLSLQPKNPVARLWAASPVDEPFEARVMQLGFHAPETASGKAGLHGAIEGKKARLYELPQGKKRIQLSLGEALVAALLKDGTVASVHWAEGKAFTETCETDAQRLLLLHTREGEDYFSIDHAPLADALFTAPLAIGQPFERIMLNSGRSRLSIAAGKTPIENRRTLHVRGGRNAVFTDKTGAVSAANDMEIGEQGGTLVVEHGPGALLAWLDRPGEEAADLWAASEKPDRTAVTLPALLPLDGKLRAYRIEAANPVMLHVRSAAPLVTYLARGEKTPEVEVHSRGVTLDAYLPGGSAELRLRAFAGGGMSGQVSISGSSVTPTDEGLGPEALLAPGSARLFSFTVRQEGMIGAGVKADSDGIDMEILNSAGAVLGKGVAQMLRLKPGPYLMKLRAPDAAAPVKVRPALVGLKAPDSGPPPEEITRYLSPEAEMPAAYSSRRGSQDMGYESQGEQTSDSPTPAAEPEYGEENGEGETGE
ncbi:MAG: hypothetical protein HY550_05315 [Elusimicrobia bacterium]|nr:hypothetical protein [Elusimicrobiota bacterium]